MSNYITNNFVENSPNTSETPKTFNDYWASCSNSMFNCQSQAISNKNDSKMASTCSSVSLNLTPGTEENKKDENPIERNIKVEIVDDEEKTSKKDVKFECNCVDKTVPYHCNEKNVWQAYEISSNCSNKIIQTKMEHFETHCIHKTDDEFKEATPEEKSHEGENGSEQFTHSRSIFDKNHLVCHTFDRLSPIKTPRTPFDIRSKLNMECNFCKSPKPETAASSVSKKPAPTNAKNTDFKTSNNPNTLKTPKKLLANRPKENVINKPRKRVKSVKKEIKNEIKSYYPFSIDTPNSSELSKRPEPIKTSLPKVQKSNEWNLMDQHCGDSDFEQSTKSSSSSSSTRTILENVPKIKISNPIKSTDHKLLSAQEESKNKLDKLEMDEVIKDKETEKSKEGEKA